MRFSEFHTTFFGSSSGAYSRVTERENYDSQITLTDDEFEIVVSKFGLQNITVGNVKSNENLSAKKFLLYPNMTEISLNLVFPKPKKSELRLYLKSSVGFKPDGGDIWFLYKKESGDLVIGSMTEADWRSLGQIDEEDENYQSEVSSLRIASPHFSLLNTSGRIERREIRGKTVYVRDPRMAALRFLSSDYKCEIEPLHRTFTAERTQKQYVEAHHFIPMKFQGMFNEPLDCLDNIVSLCPNCHRQIHHAVTDQKYEIIRGIYQKRAEMHRFEFDKIAQFYNVLEIIDK